MPIPKKGDLLYNQHDISLLDVVGKVVGHNIQTQLQHLGEYELTCSKCGFRQGQSCTDQIFLVTQLVEKIYEHRMAGFLTIISLRKAYDLVS